MKFVNQGRFLKREKSHTYALRASAGKPLIPLFQRGRKTQIIALFCLLLSSACGNKSPDGAQNDVASEKEETKDTQDPKKPPALPKRVATPILMSPIDVFGADKLLAEPFEHFPQSQFVSTSRRIPVGVSEYDRELVKKLTGKWVGYWKAKNSFTRKNPLAADLENHRVYFQFNADMTWDALWLSKFEPGHPSYAALSGKYSFKFPKMILQVEALKIEQRWSANEGDLSDLKFVCDSCDWQDANDLTIDLKLEDDNKMIFFDAGSLENGYSERVYLMKQ